MRSVVLLLAAAAVVACAPSEPPPVDPAVAPEPSGPPTMEAIGSATFPGLDVGEGPVTLEDGLWEGAPYQEGAESRPAVRLVDGFRVTADLDGDGAEEAVVLLSTTTGGSGERLHLAALEHGEAGAEVLGTAFLGDRVKIRGWRAAGGEVVLETLQAGDGDAMCCPGDLATRAWRLTGDGLTEVRSEVTGRLSLEVLDGGAAWVLRSCDVGEPAPAEPEVTLASRDGRIGGSSGCNRYTVPVEPGAGPGDLELGPAAATKMMCPEAAMQVEDRFLRQLATTTKLGFHLGRLALTYTTDEGAGTMLFERREASADPD